MTKPRIRLQWMKHLNCWWFYLVQDGHVCYWIGPRESDNQPPEWTGLPLIKSEPKIKDAFFEPFR